MTVEESKYLYYQDRRRCVYPFVRGSKFNVWEILDIYECGAVTTSQQLADKLELPLEAILEALRYCDWMKYGARVASSCTCCTY